LKGLWHRWFVEAVLDETPEKEVKNQRVWGTVVAKVSVSRALSNLRAADYGEMLSRSGESERFPILLEVQTVSRPFLSWGHNYSWSFPRCVTPVTAASAKKKGPQTFSFYNAQNTFTFSELDTNSALARGFFLPQKRTFYLFTIPFTWNVLHR
jgi:hypothetical protein